MNTVLSPAAPQPGNRNEGRWLASETFSARDFVRTGLVITLVGYALVLLFTGTYWSWLGIV